jgi:hypothetical protein
MFSPNVILTTDDYDGPTVDLRKANSPFTKSSSPYAEFQRSIFDAATVGNFSPLKDDRIIAL